MRELLQLYYYVGTTDGTVYIFKSSDSSLQIRQVKEAHNMSSEMRGVDASDPSAQN